MILNIRPVFALGLAVLLSACATDRTFGAAAGIEVTQLDTLPEPRGDFSYRIGPQEALQIEVVGAELLSGKYFTDDQGTIAFPLLGAVQLKDQTPNEGAGKIADALRGEYVVNPQVRIVPEEFPVPTISVGGQVNRPGTYPAAGKQTLLRAVTAAGGVSEYAQLDDVLVMRTVDNQDYIGLYNLEAIQRGNYSDPALFPNDIVMVGDSPAKRRLETILGLVPLATAASIIIDRTTR
ncbi:polysaccharide biosynthesis/export family protein [Parerythrobacter aestuarii]|uniref:polysaccharide biosynthesis/export family protein n=1 Tax=Parerythrobacter aestuarii TaxID=3020909 RepID=UPI0024DEB2D2|nr:polysaccharide biosynthesis/export family protein [Parerythrobacter aestuarii]